MTNSAAPDGVNSNYRGGDARYDSAVELIPSPGQAPLTRCVKGPYWQASRSSGIFTLFPTAPMSSREVWKGLGGRSPLLVGVGLAHAARSSWVQLCSNAGGSSEDALAGAPYPGGTA